MKKEEPGDPPSSLGKRTLVRYNSLVLREDILEPAYYHLMKFSPDNVMEDEFLENFKEFSAERAADR